MNGFTLMKKSQAKKAYQNYLQSDTAYLGEVYRTYSDKKLSAYDYCRELFSRSHGHNFRIVAHNQMVFTIGFECEHPVTGELYFCYITPTYNYYIPLSDVLEG